MVGDEALGLVSATVTVTTSQDSTTSAQENGSRPQATSGNVPAVQVLATLVVKWVHTNTDVIVEKGVVR